MRLPTIVIRSDVLESWLTVSDYSKGRLANELGISKGRISQLLTSRQEPSAHLIAKLITLTYLPFDRLFKIVYQLSSLESPVRVPVAAKTRKTTVTKSSWANQRSRSAFQKERGRGVVPSLKGAP